MKRIICHWTAGGYHANALDKKHYHFIFEGDGNEVPGDFPISANEKPIKGKYAAHTLNCNTGSIGLSMACMRGAKERPLDYGPSPMKHTQWNAMTEKAAELCIQYGIEVTPKTVLSHAEVQENLGIKQRSKWDFTVLPFSPGMNGAKECGDRLRNNVAFDIKQLQPSPLLPKPTAKKDMAEIHLRKSGSRTIKNSDFGQRVAGAGAIISTVSVAAQETTGILNDIPYWLWPVLVIAGCAGIYWYMRKIKQARVSDHISGVHKGRQENQEFTGENM